MLKIYSPLTGNQIRRPKSGRKPLQPKNFPANPIINHANAKPNPKPEWPEISPINDWNKENQHPSKISSFDASLAEELSAIRERLERMRIDKDETEKMLKDRDLVLDMNMKELENRGELQKDLEIEVDRLFRLKELQASCMRTPIRSLRLKEHERKTRQDQFQETRSDNRDDSKEESVKSSDIDLEK